MTTIRVNPVAIIFCRISRLPDEERGTISLDSQEYAISANIRDHGSYLTGICYLNKFDLFHILHV